MTDLSAWIVVGKFAIVGTKLPQKTIRAVLDGVTETLEAFVGEDE